MIDLLLRCETRARWRSLALNRGLAVAVVVNGETRYEAAPGVAIDEIGFYEITPAVWDGMTLVTPAVMDDWWSVNVRLFRTDDDDTLYPGETEDGFRFTKSKLVRWVREQSTPITLMGMRAYRFGTTPNRVDLFDNRDLASRLKRVWLGGMTL